MSRRAFRIAYDGRPFHGFQRQPDVTTVEGQLFSALRRLDAFERERDEEYEAEKPPGYAAAGRTDAGVSARAQTVAFDAPEWLTPFALNGELPDSIYAWAAADAPDDFHATHDANRREYRYFWLAPAADVDESRAREALDRLSGEHDFHNLTLDDEHTVRDLDASLERASGDDPDGGDQDGPDGDFLVVTVRASGFCRELVRRVVSLVQAVTESGDFARIDRILGDEPVDGPAGVPPANPHPLVLHDVDYDLDFEVDEDAVAQAQDVFGALHSERRALARVAGDLADPATGDLADSVTGDLADPASEDAGDR